MNEYNEIVGPLGKICPKGQKRERKKKKEKNNNCSFSLSVIEQKIQHVKQVFMRAQLTAYSSFTEQTHVTVTSISSSSCEQHSE